MSDDRKQIEADIALSRDAGHTKVPVPIEVLERMLVDLDKRVAVVCTKIASRGQ